MHSVHSIDQLTVVSARQAEMRDRVAAERDRRYRWDPEETGHVEPTVSVRHSAPIVRGLLASAIPSVAHLIARARGLSAHVVATPPVRSGASPR